MFFKAGVKKLADPPAENEIVTEYEAVEDYIVQEVEDVDISAISRNIVPVTTPEAFCEEIEMDESFFFFFF
jgi:hypothetical protein